MRKLSEAEREAYDRDGYVIVSGLFTAEELAKLDAELTHLMTDAKVDKARGERFIHDIGRHSEPLRAFAEDARLIALVEDLIGPGLAIHSTKVLEKKAHDTVVCHWHQDEAYYRGPKQRESHCRMSIWMPLVNTGPENGGMRVVPGSHRPGVKDHQRFDYATCRLATLDGNEAMAGAIDCPIKAGDLLLFHAKLIHSSGGNHSDRLRRALIVSYQEADPWTLPSSATRALDPEQYSGHGRILRPAATGRKKTMTGQQRVERMLSGRDHDRVPRFDTYWPQTIERWQREGLQGDADSVLTKLDADFAALAGGNVRSAPNIPSQTIQEDDQTVVKRNMWGATLRSWKTRNGTPEHIAFDCDSREKWERIYKPALIASPSAVRPDDLRQSYQAAQKAGQWTFLTGNETFEAMRKLLGDEIMLMAMADDPDWIRDISATYTDLTLRNIDVALASGVKPDGLWVYGDMAYSRGTFCSPAMYRELIWPDHHRLADAVHRHGLKLIYHTDGNVNGVIDLFVEAGFDCLQPLEAKADMDIRQLAPRYGDHMAFFGNIDARVLSTNDLDAVEQEVRSKLAAMMPHRRYGYHSDHSVPPDVSWATYQRLIAVLDEAGWYR